MRSGRCAVGRERLFLFQLKNRQLGSANTGKQGTKSTGGRGEHYWHTAGYIDTSNKLIKYLWAEYSSITDPLLWSPIVTCDVILVEIHKQNEPPLNEEKWNMW